MSKPVFHISVATTPNSSNELLSNEIQMLKSALIYADKTKLYSLSTNLLMMLLSLTQFNFNQKMILLQTFIPNVNEDKSMSDSFNFLFTQYNSINRKRNKNMNEHRFLNQLKSQIENIWDEFLPNIIKILEDSGLGKLSKAYDLGLLEIHSFKDIKNSNLMIQEYIEEILKTTNNSTTFPLLDQLTTELIINKINTEKTSIANSSNERLRHTGIVSQLMNKLPCFEGASLDEIIDIRKELENPLVNFRSLLFQFSEDIKTNIWDNDFEYDVNKKYFQKIEPSVLEIEEAVKNNSYFKALLTKVIDGKVMSAVGASPLIGLAVAGLNDLNTIIPGVIGTIAGLTQLSIASRNEFRRENKKIENNQVFFYYKVDKLLNSNYH